MKFNFLNGRASLARTVPLLRLFPGIMALGAALFLHPALKPANAEAGVEALSPFIDELLSKDAGDYWGAQNEENIRILRKVYADHGMRPFWVTTEGPTRRGRELLAALRDVDEDGLNPSDYGVTEADPYISRNPVEEFAEMDIRLSLGAMTAASDLAAGRLEPARIDPEVFIEPRALDKEKVLRAALKAGDLHAYLIGFRPAQENYHRLLKALAHYRQIRAEGGWPKMPEYLYELGSTSANVEILRERLQITGDIPSNIPPPQMPELFDDVVLRGLENFQKRHGLKVTGRTDYPTIDALNVSVDQRIQQIIINLERRRWMPTQWEDRYVFVNLADFELKVVDRGRTIFTTEVVVGAPYHRTPVFKDQIRYLVFNPYWNVPQTIATEEFLPELQRNPYYLEEEDYELLSGWKQNAQVVDPLTVNWHEVDPEHFPYRLRQKPGEKNALGNIKFMFPNKHDIYLHGTPKQELFDHNARAFSHGCIRVKDPVSLAQILLRGKDGWNRERIELETLGSSPKTVQLGSPVPVHLYYLTAWATKNGTVHFRSDIYERDRLLSRALFGTMNLL